ncbi:MAG: hypothetical protein K2X44_03330 [Magnetospirillum sp.]|nr:hypothetical protein [Magnetospirillum sp.]
MDFDAVLAVHDCALAQAAAQRGLLPPGFTGNGAELRRLLQNMPGGQAEWRRLEGRAMGPGMALAKLAPAARNALEHCRQAKIHCVILVMRPPCAPFDPERTDLHQAAMDWMRDQGFFDAHGFAIPTGNVVMVDNRRARLEAMAAHAISHMVLAADDDEPLLPKNITRVLVQAGEDWPNFF